MGRVSEFGNSWHVWFAWRPVTLLTAEIAWLRFVSRRKNASYINPLWKPSVKYEYANGVVKS